MFFAVILALLASEACDHEEKTTILLVIKDLKAINEKHPKVQVAESINELLKNDFPEGIVCELCVKEINVKELVILQCRHHFCPTCLLKWKKKNDCPNCRVYVKVLHYEEIKSDKTPSCLLSMVIKKLKTIRPIQNVENAVNLLQNEADKFDTKKRGEEIKKKNKKKERERKQSEINLAVKEEIVERRNIPGELVEKLCWIIGLLTKSLTSLPWLLTNELFFIVAYPMEYIELEDSQAAALYVVKNLFAQILFALFCLLYWNHWERTFWAIIFPWELISAIPISQIRHVPLFPYSQNFTKFARAITIFWNIYIWGLIGADYYKLLKGL